jgi:hypothetical protein
MINLLSEISTLPAAGLLLVGGCILIALASFCVAVYCWARNLSDRRREGQERRKAASGLHAL